MISDTALVYGKTNPLQSRIAKELLASFPFIDAGVYDSENMTKDEHIKLVTQSPQVIGCKKVAILYTTAMFTREHVDAFDKEVFILCPNVNISKEVKEWPYKKIGLNGMSAKEENVYRYPWYTCPERKFKELAKGSMLQKRVYLFGGSKHIDYQGIRNSIKFSDILCIDNPNAFSNANQISNKELEKSLHGMFAYESVDISSCDVAVVPKHEGELTIHKALSAGLVVLAEESIYSLDLAQRYSCLLTYRPENLQEIYARIEDHAIITSLREGVLKYQELRSPDKIREFFTINFAVKSPPVVKDTDNNVVNVFMLCRNNEESIGRTLSYLRVMERRLSRYKFNYYLYENDSADDTPDQIKDFYRHANGKFFCGVFNKEHWGAVNFPSRMLDLASYRNSMKDLCDTWEDSEYSFVIDSEIEFSLDIMEKQITFLQNHPQAVMVTPYGMPQHSRRNYYDTYAYEDLEGGDKIPDTQDPFEVSSAFSGFVCVRSNAFKHSHWDCEGRISEHKHWCHMLQSFGKIYVDPSVQVFWKK